MTLGASLGILNSAPRQLQLLVEPRPLRGGTTSAWSG